jgi:hypothetical protein
MPGVDPVVFNPSIELLSNAAALLTVSSELISMPCRAIPVDCLGRWRLSRTAPGRAGDAEFLSSFPQLAPVLDAVPVLSARSCAVTPSDSSAACCGIRRDGQRVTSATPAATPRRNHRDDGITARSLARR